MQWIHVTAAAASAGVLFILLVIFIRRCFWSRTHKQLIGAERIGRTVSLQDGISKLHQPNNSLHQQIIIDLESKRRGNNYYYMFRRGGSGVSAKPLFSWSDHPALVTDAVENGWSRFAFTGYMSSLSTKSPLLAGLCAVGGDYEREAGVEMSWEVCQGSADFMQKIRLNSGLKKKINNTTSGSSMAAAAAASSASSVIRTALPLPGPPLMTSSFPQEAYFEITILSSREEDGNNDDSFISSKLKEGEKTKLIKENSNGNANSDSLIHVSKIEELKINVGKDDSCGGEGRGGGGKGGGEGVVVLSVGLTGGGTLPPKLPGSYHGSIGFNSNGSVFLDGIELVFESEKAEWGRRGIHKVIGCGFDPRQKKVLFTVGSELVHVIHCNSEEFGAPLYPTLAANNDITVLVNFGQSAFEYAPANAQRTPNPCFISPSVNSPATAAALGYEEDSKELFSMGRIDSQWWLNRSTTKSSTNNGSVNNNYRAGDFDEESEADLFEIVLDSSSGRSPNIVS